MISITETYDNQEDSFFFMSDDEKKIFYEDSKTIAQKMVADLEQNFLDNFMNKAEQP